MEPKSEAETLRLVGGALCLDLVNTVGDRRSERSNEHLASYADLVMWSKHAGILLPRAAQRLVQEAGKHPAEALQVLERAHALREALYRIFVAFVTAGKPKASDLGVLNEVLARMSGARIVPTESGYGWDWTHDEKALDQVLYPIARSAAELLVSGDLSRVRECEGDNCGWLFVDTSKNRTRRWCSMDDCGNLAKARRHYRRVRSANLGVPETPQDN